MMTTGFLPHEIKFLDLAIYQADHNLALANEAYGDAVASSGGDWAFDDPASATAALEAHFKEKDVLALRELRLLSNKIGVMDYPDPGSDVVSIGTRVHLEDEFGTDVFDVVSRLIPRMPVELDVLQVTPSSPLGSALLGRTVGDLVDWTGPSGHSLSAKIVKVDQTAVRRFYSDK